MRLILIALLAAISYAQTAPAGGASAGQNPFDPMTMNPLMYGMYDEMMDLGDMYPELGDMYDNFMPMASQMFGGASGAGGAAGGAGGLAGMMGQLPFMGGDINDIMSDVVDNMKDGDIVDVMENLLPLQQMGIDVSSIMQGGMPDLGGIMGQLSPYMMMDGGDMFGDLGDLYNFGSDMFEDYFKYGGMSGMGGMQGLPDMSQMMSMFGGEMESPMLRKARAHRLHKKLRRRRPSRLLKKTRTGRKLRKPREFPWYSFLPQQAQSGSGSTSRFPFFGFDAPDSEDIQNFLMMGGDRSRIPPPLDGIDMEDLWMYRGTKWDPMAMFNKATGQASNNDAGTQSNSGANNFWLYSLLSGLQKAHMQRKH